ncbi:hypothetical protein [Streptomyces sp. NPDC058674]|uniref:hypothetical protein n=1 Tax=Streptomyces sp. NPDC058674 TaxID=3346592 RepID=UPI00364A2ED3
MEEAVPCEAVSGAVAMVETLVPEDDGSAEAAMREKLALRYNTVKTRSSAPCWRFEGRHDVCSMSSVMTGGRPPCPSCALVEADRTRGTALSTWQPCRAAAADAP